MRRLVGLVAIVGLIGLTLWLGQVRGRSSGSRGQPPAPAVAVPAVTVVPTGAAPPPPEQAGEATYYDAAAMGACSFEPEPGASLVAAVGPEAFAGSAACGAYLEVRGPRGAAVVRVVDLCAGCGPGQIDLSRDAFAQVAELALGRAPVRWRLASPALPGPIAYHFKAGSSAGWAAVQVRNHRNPVAELAYRRPDGSWAPLARGADNYFVSADGMGAGPYALRITDSYGNLLIDEAVPLAPGRSVSGADQLPARP
jgi:expansin (peptidoglycan-binding protein)